MIGIFIKEAEVPESCFVCPCMFGGICFVHPSEQDGVLADTVDELYEKGGKPDWCPIVEAEIDKDELVRRGRWIRTSKPCASTIVQHCSECGMNTNYDLTYCPDCGAKMAGGDSP